MLSGVPQGSILGPLLYTLYTSEIVNVMKECKYHLYADDTQIYHSFEPKLTASAVSVINKDLSSLVQTSSDHCLTINPIKTSVLLFGPQNLRNAVLPLLKLKIQNRDLSITDTARNLGITFDATLRFRPHINNCIRAAYSNLKMIYNNRYTLSKKNKIMLCESLVLSRFRFCDTVYGPFLYSDDVRRIQVVQNACLRLIFGLRKNRRISHKLREVGWLNMSNRRVLHSACLYHKIIANRVPAYLHRKIVFRADVHNVNVRFKGRLTPPLHKTEMFKQSFSYQVTKVYNNLPDIRHLPLPGFKKWYKKFLYDKQLNVVIKT